MRVRKKGTRSVEVVWRSLHQGRETWAFLHTFIIYPIKSKDATSWRSGMYGAPTKFALAGKFWVTPVYLAEQNNWNIIAMETDKDHIHLLLEYDATERTCDIISLT